ncbi:hypothetical protein ABZP36_012428 [Zizania latifolia]
MHPSGGGALSVPPGFRFHPTEEELLYYYLRKKVAYETIDLDVIREIDLNKLEPWDLKDRCRIGTGPQKEWYLFSHKDKKYPTGTRTNRATTTGFWKATGRDKAIFLANTCRIGMRKTLVFYVGRAPHGKKTDWIMHEYRLDQENVVDVQEDGWVVCRMFMKKNYQRGIDPAEMAAADDDELLHHSFPVPPLPGAAAADQKHNPGSGGHLIQHHQHYDDFPSFDPSLQLPRLMSAEQLPAVAAPSSLLPGPPAAAMSSLHVECSQSLMKLTSAAAGGSTGLLHAGSHRFANSTDWSILEKLLASHQNLDQLFQGRVVAGATSPASPIHRKQLMKLGGSASSFKRLPLQHLGCEADLLRFSM